MSDQFIERSIVIGLITSTPYIKQIRGLYKSRLLTSPMARRLASWCIEYYDKYKKAPRKNIKAIYFEKLRGNLPRDIAEEIEQDILPSLNKQFISKEEDLQPLIDQTKKYFALKHLEIHQEKVKTLIDADDVEGAQRIISSFKGISQDEDDTLNFSDVNAKLAVEKAFEESSTPLFTYTKALGAFWNSQLIRGGFISFMSMEKRGKSFQLMGMATAAVKEGNKVAFFQAGDMSQEAQIRRFCIHLAERSDQEQYCGKMHQPVIDCMYNQLNLCDKPERECDYGVFDQFTEKDIRTATFEDILTAFNQNPEYKPCYNCKLFVSKPWGVPWVKKVNVKYPLEKKEAVEVFENYFIKPKREIMLSSHPNNTLSVTKIRALLDTWEIQFDFVPDIIIIDYADLLVPDVRMEFRHQQNEIWKALRGLSQEKRRGIPPLIITATQADANSYDRDLLRLKNFSEDKRKYAHVTAMYGLNQDPHGREKKIGIMRINELVIREGSFDDNRVVHVLQNLKRGQPCLGSYF